ncbi:restriction endonuclease subunit S, partial [Flavobacteriaceae bacterium]|nr:restriction endonuclease subunit S [Flavobacteriaceae bacterium]
IHISSGDGLTSKEMIDGDVPVFGGNGVTGYHNKYNVDKKTITIGRVGAYCGAVHLTPQFAWITDNCFQVFFDNDCFHIEYLIWYLKYMNLGAMSYKSSQPVISGKRIYPLLSFLPPIEEQRVISEKVQNLMLKLKYLEDKVIDSENLSNLLTKAVLKESFDVESI